MLFYVCVVGVYHEIVQPMRWEAKPQPIWAQILHAS